MDLQKKKVCLYNLNDNCYKNMYDDIPKELMNGSCCKICMKSKRAIYYQAKRDTLLEAAKARSKANYIPRPKKLKQQSIE